MKNLKQKIILSILASFLLFVFAIKAQAQKAEAGIRYMPTISAFDLKNSDGGSVHGQATFGHGGGILIGYSLTDLFEIQGEVIYNTLSQKYKEQDIERNINLRYINIPILASFNTGKKKLVNFNAVVGPQIGLNVGSSVKTTSGNIINVPDAVVSVSKGDLGFAYGVGVDFGLNSSKTFRLGIGFRGVYGLFDISDHSKTIVTNSYYVIDHTHIKTYSAYIGASYLFL